MMLQLKDIDDFMMIILDSFFYIPFIIIHPLQFLSSPADYILLIFHPYLLFINIHMNQKI